MEMGKRSSHWARTAGTKQVQASQEARAVREHAEGVPDGSRGLSESASAPPETGVNVLSTLKGCQKARVSPPPTEPNRWRRHGPAPDSKGRSRSSDVQVGQDLFDGLFGGGATALPSGPEVPPRLGQLVRRSTARLSIVNCQCLTPLPFRPLRRGRTAQARLVCLVDEVGGLRRAIEHAAENSTMGTDWKACPTRFLAGEQVETEPGTSRERGATAAPPRPNQKMLRDGQTTLSRPEANRVQFRPRMQPPDIPTSHAYRVWIDRRPMAWPVGMPASPATER